MTGTPPDFDRRAEALRPDFELRHEIGRGGMGVVYLALDVRLDRLVAVKILPEALADSPDVRERFLREARTAARLSHPNIVSIYRAEEMHGVVFIVMAYVDGESLAERLTTRGTLAPADAAPLLRDVALALDYAHRRGVVHRDVKPENILVERESGRALVTDFGIARLTEATSLTATGQVLGSVHYMSPEQASGDAIDGRSDVYSLGVVAFRTLTGRLPFDSETAAAVLVAHVTRVPPRVVDVAPTVPPTLAAVIDACLAKDPAARYQNGAALARALDEAAHEIASHLDAPPPPSVPPVISEREAQALWARAAQLQAETGVHQPAAPPLPPAHQLPSRDRRSLTSGYRFTDVRAAAEEAGISERYVARAAAELGLATPVPSSERSLPSTITSTGTSAITSTITSKAPAANPWAGGSMSILYEVQVPGEPAESDYELLVDLIQQHVGDGQVSMLGRSLRWSAKGERRLHVSIVPRGGQTTIRADERLTPLAGGLFGGIVGGAGGGSAGAAFGIGTAALHSVAAGFGLWGVGIAASYALARTLFRVTRARRDRQLHTLVQQLAAHVRPAVRELPTGR